MRLRSLIVVLAILSFSSVCFARARYNGIASKGGKNVPTSPATSYKLMETFPNCTITVYLAGTTTLVSIYSDNLGTTKANPFFANSDASFFFYVDNGRYDIKFSGTGISSPFTWPDILVNDQSSGSYAGIYKLSSYNGDLQAAIDDVSFGEVQLDRASVTMTKPLIVTKDNISIGGLNKYGVSVIRGSNFYGPLVYVLPPNYPSITPYLTTSLASGSGNSYILPGLDAARYLNLSDADTMNINGLSQLTVECFVKPTTDSTGSFNTRDILSSNGKISTNSSNSSAFYIYQYVNNTIRAIITTSTASIILTTPDNSLLINQVNHIALTYDGVTARVFVNGVLKVSSAITGTIKQEPHEMVTLGISSVAFPQRTTVNQTMSGTIDSIRISSIARYIANFTNPTAKFGSDINTRLLINFDTFYRGMLVAQTKDYPAYIPFRMCGLCAGALLKAIKLHNLEFVSSSGGLYLTSAVWGRYEHLYFDGQRIGMWFYDNTYISSIEDVHINVGYPNGLAGLLISSQSGVYEIDSMEISGGNYSLATGTSSANFNRLLLNPNQRTKYSAVLKNGGSNNSSYILNYTTVDYETTPEIAPLGNLLFDGNTTVVMNGGVLEMSPGAPYIIPNIVLDGGYSYTFTGIQTNNPQFGEYIKFISAPIGVATLINPYKLFASQPYGSGSDLLKIQVFDPNGGITLGGGVLFANLSASQNSTIIFCSDCTNASNPCSNGGTGAIAKRLNGAWDCR